MDLGLLNFEIGGDNSKFNQAIEDAKKKAQELQTTLQGGTQSQAFKINIDTSAAKRDAQELQSSFRNIFTPSVSSSGLNSSIEALELSLKRLTERYRLLSDAQRNSSAGGEMLNGIKQQKSNLDSLYQSMNPSINKANEGLNAQSGIIGYLQRRLIGYFALYQSADIVKQLYSITGEFQKQKVALESMLQNAPAADALFNQIKSFSVVSPFNFKDLVGQAKQLAAYSIPAQDLMSTLKMLGDVAAGTGTDMSRLVLAYGEVNTQTLLTGRQLRQFTQAGVPLVDDLAKHFTKLTGTVVNAGDVFTMVSKKKVSFGDVQEAMTSMTSKGGMFYQMQEKQADTLAGKVSNLKDKIDIMTAALGQSGEGLLSGGVDAIAAMAQHWEATLKIIRSIVLAYGAYKATVAITNILEKDNLATKMQQAAVEKTIAATKGAEVGETVAGGVGNVGNVGSLASTLGSKLGLAAAGLSIVYGIYSAYKADQDQQLQQTFDTVNQIDNETEANSKLIERLSELSKESSKNAQVEQERNSIITKLAQTEPELSAQIDIHRASVEGLTLAEQQYKQSQEVKKSITFAINDTSNGNSYKESQDSYNKTITEREKGLAELTAAYSRMSNSIKQYKENGLSTGGIDKIPDDVIDSMYKVINGSQSMYDKLQALHSLTASGFSSASFWSNSNTAGAMVDYSKAIEEVNQKTRGLNYDTRGLAETIKTVAKEHNININTADGKAQISSIIKSMSDINDESKKKIFFLLGIKWSDGDPIKQLTGWRKDLQDFLGKNVITITMDDNMDEVTKSIQAKYKDLKTEVANYKPILVKLGINTTQPVQNQLNQTNNLPFWQRSTAAEVVKNNDEAKKATDKLTQAHNQLGIVVDATQLKTKKAKTNIDDPYIKGLDLQKKKIDAAREAYEKYTKVFSSSEAIGKMKTQNVFTGGVKTSDLNIEGSDKGYETFLQKSINEMYGRLQNAGKKYNKNYIKNAIQDFVKALHDTQANEIINSAESKINDIQSELQKYKPEWNLYKQLLNITGDKESSLQTAFGGQSAQDIISYYRDEINKALKASGQPSTVNVDTLLNMKPSDMKKNGISDSIKSMTDELHSTMVEAKSTAALDIANLVAQYGDLDTKKKIITGKANELRSEAQNSGLYTTSFEDALQKQLTKEMQDLEDSALELTPFYQKLFGNISDLSLSSLKKLLQQAKDSIEQMKKDANPIVDKKSGQITGYELTTVGSDGKIKTVQTSLAAFNRILKQTGEVEKDVEKIDPFTKFSNGLKDIKKGDTSDGIKKIGESVGSLSNDLSTTSSSASTMFSALGDDKTAAAMTEISGLAGGVGNIASGIASGNPVQVITGITGAVTTLAQAHDNKLNAAIEKSKQKVKELQNRYTDLTREIDRQLGSITEDQYSETLTNYQSQLSEIQLQLADERKKKKSDKSAISDYEEEITSLEDKIKYLSEDTAKSVYGIDIKDWASQISDSLVNAFSKGEDAANAFDDTVASIMKSVVQNMIKVAVIEPAMEKLRTYLFGDNGVLNDGNLSTSDALGLVSQLTSLKTSIATADQLYQSISDTAYSAGIDMSGSTSSSGITASEQSLTETTGNILASYINSIREDVAKQLLKIDDVISALTLNQTTFSLALTELKAINTNTKQIVDNTSRIDELTTFFISKVGIKGSGTGLNMN